MGEIRPTDEKIVAVLYSIRGARTGRLAREIFDIPSQRPWLLRRLRALEAKGRVARCSRYSAENDIYWIVPTLADIATKDSPRG